MSDAMQRAPTAEMSDPSCQTYVFYHHPVSQIAPLTAASYNCIRHFYSRSYIIRSSVFSEQCESRRRRYGSNLCRQKVHQANDIADLQGDHLIFHLEVHVCKQIISEWLTDDSKEDVQIRAHNYDKVIMSDSNHIVSSEATWSSRIDRQFQLVFTELFQVVIILALPLPRGLYNCFCRRLWRHCGD